MTRRRPTRREVLWTLAAVPALSRTWRADRVRFSNITFEPREEWTVATQAPRMILRPRPEPEGASVRVTIDPAATFSGPPGEAVETAWRAALGGRTGTGQRSRQDDDLNAGAKLTLLSQAISGGGGRALAAVVFKEQLTALVLTADAAASFAQARTAFAELASTIEIAEEAIPEPTVFAVGADPSDSFNWHGPPEFANEIYDYVCRDPEKEFDVLLRKSQGFAGAVRPRAVTFSDAVAVVKRLMQEAAARGNVASATALGSKETPTLYAIGAGARLMQGDPLGALAQMGVALDADATHPNTLLNTASLLAMNGMPNEALAMIGQLESSGRTPVLPMKLNAEAAVAHTKGYAQMLRGELAAAETNLARAHRLEPMFIEATHTLSVVQAAAGRRGEALNTYREGLYRRMPPLLVDCEAPEDGPYAVAATTHPKHCRPPIDQMHDTSQGLPGVLPPFNHPGNCDELNALSKKLAPEIERLVQEGRDLSQAAIALAAQVDQSMAGTPYDAWAAQQYSLATGLDAQEPLIRQLTKHLRASQESAGDAASRFSAAHLRRVMDLSVAGLGDEALCQAIRDSANRGISQVRPHVVALETMHRRYAKSWYRMATGIAAHVGDPKWHKLIATDLRAVMVTYQGAFLLDLLKHYAEFHAPATCPREQPPKPFTNQAVEDALKCPEALRGPGLKFSFKLPLPETPSLGVKVNCDKITLELSLDLVKVPDSPLLQASIGAFAQLELKNKGQYSVFFGAKESIGVLGVGESGKQGIYFSGNFADLNQIDTVGLKTTGESFQRTGEWTISSKTDAMDIDVSLLPSVPAPAKGPGIPLQPFGGAPRTGGWPLPPAR